MKNQLFNLKAVKTGAHKAEAGAETFWTSEPELEPKQIVSALGWLQDWNFSPTNTKPFESAEFHHECRRQMPQCILNIACIILNKFPFNYTSLPFETADSIPWMMARAGCDTASKVYLFLTGDADTKSECWPCYNYCQEVDRYVTPISNPIKGVYRFFLLLFLQFSKSSLKIKRGTKSKWFFF
jgi:hypothetical protein